MVEIRLQRPNPLHEEDKDKAVRCVHYRVGLRTIVWPTLAFDTIRLITEVCAIFALAGIILSIDQVDLLFRALGARIKVVDQEFCKSKRPAPLSPIRLACPVAQNARVQNRLTKDATMFQQLR